MIGANNKTYTTKVVYKNLEFDVEYDYNDGFFDTQLKEQFQAEVFICNVSSLGDEVIMTWYELVDIAELVKTNHVQGKYK